MAEVKRLHYFKYQFLREPDFTDEQNYHKDMRRLHNRSLHTAGVVAGFNVSKTSESSIEVSPGLALDVQGNEIYLQEKWTHAIAVSGDAERYVSIEYMEQQSDPVEDAGSGVAGNTRWTEQAVLKVSQKGDIDNARVIILGRIIIKSGKITSIDEGEGDAIRTLSGAAGSLGYENTIQDFGALLRSGFYEGCDNITGDVPDTSHQWSHLITSRHSNRNNNHQLQIASSYEENDQIFFRKIRGGLTSRNPDWHEMATRESNTFSGDQKVINGNIGIGTTNPQDKLDINGAIRFNGNSSRKIFGDARNSRNAVVLKGHWDELEVKGRVIDWSGTALHIGYENDHTSHYIEMGRKVGFLRFLSGGGTTETMRITGGKVGIGTSNPGAPLHVASYMAVGPFSATGGQGGIDVTGTAAELGFVRRNLQSWPANPKAGDRFVWYNQDGSSAHLWTHEKGNLLSIAKDGNVGIGKTNPQEKLDVNGRIKCKNLRKQVFANNQISTDSGAYTDIANMTITEEFGDGPVLIILKIPTVRSRGDSSWCFFRIVIDGQEKSVSHHHIVGSPYETHEVALVWMDILQKGGHTIKGQWRKESGDTVTACGWGGDKAVTRHLIAIEF